MLKKMIIAAAAVTALGSVSYAMNNPDFIENVPGITFRTSNNVKIGYKNSSDTETKPQKYSIVSKHTSGDTYYATSNNSTTIFKQTNVQSYTGHALALGDAQVNNLIAGDSLFDGWEPM